MFYAMKCGHLSYTVAAGTPIYTALAGCIFWAFVQKMEGSTEKTRADISEFAEKALAMGAPGWIVNGAIAFGTNNDLRRVYISDFFTRSKYAAKKEA